MVGQKLSNLDRARALGYLQSGRSARNVARTFHVSPTTMTNLLRRYNQTGDVKDRPRSGRPKVTTPVEDRRIRTIGLRRRVVSSPNIQSQIHAARGRGALRLSRQTIRNRLNGSGLRSRQPSVKQRLLPGHTQARLRWARIHAHWTRAQWRNVLFSDESRFSLHHNDRRMRLWRRRGERFQKCCVRENMQGQGGSVLVWGGITEQGRTQLVGLNANVNARRYIDNILRPVVVPFA
jgi:hypothetical protein